MKTPTNLHGYALERPLGKGGMGSVWVARKLSTHQLFAIKFLKEEFLEDPTYLARFEREVAALRAIRHPNVVNVFEWSMPKNDPDAKPYVVMELMEGDGLDRLLRRQRILQPQLAVSIMLQVLDGLAAAHNVGVVHRDLGPSNIHLTPQPNGAYLARVLDFGLARPVTSEEEAQVTQAGTLMGKPGYVAPETFTQKPADARVDLFACGMILYRMLAGRLPYKETQAHFLWAERYAETTHDREYPMIRDLAAWVPEKLAMVVGKAVRRKPEERYHTAEDMQVDLLDIEDSSLARAGEATPSPPPKGAEVTSTLGPESLDVVVSDGAKNRRRWVLLGGGAALAALLGVVLLVWGLGGSETTTAGSGSDTATSMTVADDVSEASPADAGAESEPVVATADVGEDEAVPPVAVIDAAPPPVDAPSGPPMVLIVVAGAPAGAAIKVGDVVPEGDPPKARLPVSEDLVTVTVEAPGFEKFTELILPTSDRVVSVRMRPIRRPPPPRRDAGGTSFPEFPEGP